MAVRIATLVLLGLLAGGGIFGGILLLTAPDGSGLGLDLGMLPAWWPSDYFWAGVLLLGVFGLGSVITGVALLARPRLGAVFAALLGLALVGWMLVQIGMIGLILPPMQLGFVAVGVALVVLGVVSLRRARPVAAG